MQAFKEGDVAGWQRKDEDGLRAVLGLSAARAEEPAGEEVIDEEEDEEEEEAQQQPVAPEAGAPPLPPPPQLPLDEFDLDLRDPRWTRERLMEASLRTLPPDEDLKDCLLSHEDARMPPRAGGAGSALVALPSAKRLFAVVASAQTDEEAAPQALSFLRVLAACSPPPPGATLRLFCGREIDVQKLFSAVAALGGMGGIAAQRKWSALADCVSGKTSLTNKGLLHKQAYELLLVPYERRLRASGAYEQVCAQARSELGGSLGLDSQPAPPLAAAALPAACALCAAAASEPLTCDYCNRTYCTPCGFDPARVGSNVKWFKCRACAVEDPNDDWCSICNEEGELLLCDGCPTSVHLQCVGLEAMPDGDWRCHRCAGAPMEE